MSIQTGEQFKKSGFNHSVVASERRCWLFPCANLTWSSLHPLLHFSLTRSRRLDIAVATCSAAPAMDQVRQPLCFF